MGACQSRQGGGSTTLVLSQSQKGGKDGRSVLSASESTVAASNTATRHTQQQQSTSSRVPSFKTRNSRESSIQEEDQVSHTFTGSSSEDAQEEGSSRHSTRFLKSRDPPSTSPAQQKSTRKEKERKKDPEGGYFHKSPLLKHNNNNNDMVEYSDPVSSDSSAASRDDPVVVTVAGISEPEAPEPRRLWFTPSTMINVEDKAVPRITTPQKKRASVAPKLGTASLILEESESGKEDTLSTTGGTTGGGKKEKSTKRSSKKSRNGSSSSSTSKKPIAGFSSSIRNTIPEEQDPEMPSDEEDFCEELVRNTPQDEPGRLLPVKLKTRKSTSLASVLVAGGGGGANHHEGAAASMLSGKDAVHLHTLSEFQRLKLQVKLQKHQELKDRRLHKVEDRLQDGQAYKKLWQEYQNAEQELARMEQEIKKSAPHGKMKRSNSFDLKDSGSWFFDFNSPDAALNLPPEPDVEFDNASQASLSLLSEQSLDAQRRYYAEKRRKRKERKKQGKLEKRQQKMDAAAEGPATRVLEGATPEALARLNNNNNNMAHSLASAGTRDYGPVRDIVPPTPLDVEVSFQNAVMMNAVTHDDAGSVTGSYVSDLGDESWGGGFGGSASLSGHSYYQQASHAGSVSCHSNDYGVKRRIRPPGSSNHRNDHRNIQAKLKSLEQSLAKLRQGEGTTTVATEEDSTPKAAGSSTAAGVDTKQPDASISSPEYVGLPISQLIEKFEEGSQGSKTRGYTTKTSSKQRKTHNELADQIQEAILAASTPTRTTRKSRKEFSKSELMSKPEGVVIIPEIPSDVVAPPPLAVTVAAAPQTESLKILAVSDKKEIFQSDTVSLYPPAGNVAAAQQTESLTIVAISDKKELFRSDSLTKARSAAVQVEPDEEHAVVTDYYSPYTHKQARNEQHRDASSSRSPSRKQQSSGLGFLSGAAASFMTMMHDSSRSNNSSSSHFEASAAIVSPEAPASDSSTATGPQLASRDVYHYDTMEHEDENYIAEEEKGTKSINALLRESGDTNAFSEEKKEDHLSESSRTGDTPDATESKVFFRKNSNNPESDDDVPPNSSVRKFRPYKFSTPSTVSTVSSHEDASPPSASFWNEEIDNFLLKNIPERTDVYREVNAIQSTPLASAAVLVTPETTRVDLTDDAIVTKDGHGGYFGDPDGRRIDAAASLRLADQVEAQVTEVLTKYREVETKVSTT